jgi:hypothetical protein
MKLNRIIGTVLILIVVAFAGYSVFLFAMRDRTFALYTGKLDDWVTRSGSPQQIQSSVVEPCGKIVMSQVGPIEMIRLATIDREEFDFRVDVCVKMTINRLHAQPEFENAELVKSICEGDYDLFRRLCQHSGVKLRR